MSPTRRLAAIADMVGYLRLLKAGEAETTRKRCQAIARRWP